jgi:hypothetical protein
MAVQAVKNSDGKSKINRMAVAARAGVLSKQLSEFRDIYSRTVETSPNLPNKKIFKIVAAQLTTLRRKSGEIRSLSFRTFNRWKKIIATSSAWQ